MRKPTKAELSRLLILYKTDKKIAEALGVRTQLVTYWRAKKKIPKLSLLKYSKIKIKELWERWGEDEKAGEELGITAGAFYKWRRKYGILERPKVLKYQQLEFSFSSPAGSSTHTLIQKILALKAGSQAVRVNENIEIEPDWVILNQNLNFLMEQMQNSGPKKISNPHKIIILLPHFNAEGNNFSYLNFKKLLKEHKIRNIFSSQEGLAYQTVLENRMVSPYQLTATLDPEFSALGGLGILNININNSTLAEFLSHGKISLKVPETVKVTLSGTVSEGIFAKDISLFLTAKLNEPNFAGKGFEFCGPVVEKLPLKERMTLCQQVNSSNIFSSMVPFDSAVKKHLSAPYSKSFNFVLADAQAEYSAELDLELSWLEPQIGIVGSEVEIKPLAKVKKHKISWAILGASADSNLEDLEIAAKILKGRKIPKEVRMAVIPGSKTVYLNALKKNLVRTFLQAGCIFLYPGSNSFNFFEDDKIISTFNWNLSKQQLYLASPATVAASALKGKIADPREFL